MDGTLLTSIAATERVWTRWAERHGLDVPTFLPTMHGRRAIDTISAQGLDGIDVEAEARWVFEAEMADVAGIEPAPGIAAFLTGIPIDRWAVVTSALRPLAERRMAAAGLTIPDVVVAAEDVSNGKPAPDGFILAAQRLGVSTQNCLVFEDSGAGVEAARNAGASVFVVTGFQHAPHSFGHPSATDFKSLLIVSDSAGSLSIEKT
ncbi:HAD-superfamily hydrolase subfamily IA, variant 1 and 3 [Fulvimarina pelagi HTCC2506]|uniref:HAD-superfamily hydrolase subfamily IA, variant 1 and 3 n=2 Tax=Fulvimarina pelagi TaxID=217511 RepID=Q0FXF4_9HYPH|nr:HAD-IA family hydrolase [Fulvimarina pelagi]EAU39696.1 HAD-superfamily hydrolase subfamily IA, variant 1 and 3 [Fulvimarina pelagi HTCC2506]